MRLSTSLLALAAASCLATTTQAQTLLGGGKTAPTFSIVLSQSGSYKLAGNLNVPSGVDGIVIGNGANVTLDLGGYQLSGAAACTKAGCGGALQSIGIKIGGNAVVHVFNGAVRGFGLYGIGIDSQSPASTVMAEDLMVTGNFNGVFLAQLTAHRVVAQNNAAHGINATHGLIAASTAYNNGATGISMNYGLVRDSRSLFNAIGFEHFSGVAEGNMSISNAQGNKIGTIVQSMNAFY